MGGAPVVFPLGIVEQAWAGAGGRCECRHAAHGHGTTCGRVLIRELRGRRTLGGWQARTRIPPLFAATTAAECEIVCWPCYAAEDLHEVRAAK